MKIIKNLLTTIRSSLPLCACIFLLNACQDDDPVINSSEIHDINTENYGDLFKYVWEGLDKNYVFWDIDPTDWDEVYRKYFPKFQALPTGLKNHHLDQKNLEQARKLFEESMGSLIDGHLSFKGLHDSKKKAWRFSPLDAKRLKESGDNPPILSSVYFDHSSPQKGIMRFLSEPEYNKSGSHSGSPKMILGKIKKDDKILYFTFRSFYLTGSYNNNVTEKGILNKLFQRIQDPSYKGIIIDLRNNSGGDLVDTNFLTTRFVQKPHIACYSRFKDGPNRRDYSPWAPFTLSPHPEQRTIPKFPIVILVNVNSASMAEITPVILSRQSNVTVVGETTFGAFGPIYNTNSKDETIFNRNSFTVGKYPLSITVRGATANTKSFDGKRYEGKGFSPDETVKLDWNKALQKNEFGRITDMSEDTQLDRAIEIIQEKSKS